MAGISRIAGRFARPRNPRLDRYLLDGERVVVAVHQHWARVLWPVVGVVCGLVLVLWVDAHATSTWTFLATFLWWAWFALLAWTVWQLFEWRTDWFVATDKRLLLTYGIVTTRVAMMPLMKVTDMSYVRSVPGRALGYGRFVLESAGQDQALRNVNWVPQPDHTYRAICAEIFGVDDHDRVLVEVETDDGEGQPLIDPRWREEAPDLPGSPVNEIGASSTAVPLHLRQAGGEVLYDSEARGQAARRRERSADTGPLPTKPPRPRRDTSDD